MLATFEAEQLIDSQSYEGIDRIFTGSIPEEAKPDANSTDILITESAGDMPEDYGNDDFVNLNRAVEVQIFYSVNTDFDISEFEIALMHLFSHNGWRVETSRPHTQDPDTNQVTKVFYFAQLKYI
ncbi:DUF806 family protein [Lactobacillus sp. LC28-10]|uniref:DUF806 family protein n=1 Tax=Secundilactobacillus angelensis TaxID=2722706 RepID=A0ABX1KUU5_9LACO|nr:DUF806 family protein [Secundilactobacillus angelensis]MCH5461503.1 DUF806 family protein [Secundilactobacillus angelensis]NLR17684.1 DUF806 family protein [Secundilactobacillus angelensis]